jgi:hypothetical protein
MKKRLLWSDYSSNHWCEVSGKTIFNSSKCVEKLRVKTRVRVILQMCCKISVMKYKIFDTITVLQT